ncbi:MAG: response regulator transcription factor [Cyclobacteriaceae bacterium]|nr:response regulator transcription factor [Cyclobacteriaceae bacterium SS2]
MKILIIEDEAKVANHLKTGLEEQGYEVDISYDGEFGLRMFKQHTYDMLLVDVILPGKNGFEICREVRSTDQQIKIIMLTALGTIDDKMDGFDSGADDYLVKPFEFRELLARIRSVAKRKMNPTTDNNLSVADLVLDMEKKTAVRDGKKIELTFKEYSLLEFLLRNKGKVLSRAEITEHVWDLDFDPGTNVVDVYINILRKKIDKDYSPRLSHTKIGMGYYLDVEP